MPKLLGNFCEAEITRHLLQVAERDVNEIAGFIEAALQHDGVPVGIEPQELTEGLKAEQSGALHGGSRRFGEIPPDEIEDEPA